MHLYSRLVNDLAILLVYLFIDLIVFIQVFVLYFSTAGDLKFWDPRFTESVRSLSLQQDFTCVDIHPRADVLAW